eukprot:GHVR01144473.1.p1 GENE.GHVR01144473.1~~GHVR01144473.1.p1  ORF type:complete len:232 (+),score=37.43 GHVR01144473.1:48-743(+)
MGSNTRFIPLGIYHIHRVMPGDMFNQRFYCNCPNITMMRPGVDIMVYVLGQKYFLHKKNLMKLSPGIVYLLERSQQLEYTQTESFIHSGRKKEAWPCDPHKVGTNTLVARGVSKWAAETFFLRAYTHTLQIPNWQIQDVFKLSCDFGAEFLMAECLRIANTLETRQTDEDKTVDAFTSRQRLRRGNDTGMFLSGEKVTFHLSRRPKNEYVLPNMNNTCRVKDQENKPIVSI